jgi:hypothetical protein
MIETELKGQISAYRALLTIANDKLAQANGQMAVMQSTIDALKMEMSSKNASNDNDSE